MRILLIVIIFLGCCSGCASQTSSSGQVQINRTTYHRSPYLDTTHLHGKHIELYEKTKCWELAVAVYEEDTAKIKSLCRKDTTLVHCRENKFQGTLLEWAVFNYRYYASKALLECGADPNAKDYENKTPFIYAARVYETSDYLKLLLAYGGNVNSRSNDGQNKTPLFAAAKQRLESVKILVNAGANINDTSGYYGLTALHWACVTNKIDIVEYLIIDCKADYILPLMDNKRENIDFINNMDFQPGTPEYASKMRVLEYIKKHERK